MAPAALAGTSAFAAAATSLWRCQPLISWVVGHNAGSTARVYVSFPQHVAPAGRGSDRSGLVSFAALTRQKASYCISQLMFYNINIKTN